MGRFSPQERREFLAMKESCYRGFGSADLLAYIGDRLHSFLRADATCMVQLDPTTALPTYVVSQGWLESDFQPLVEHALLRSPTADPGRLILERRRTVLVDELLPPDQPYYHDPYFEYHLLLRGYRYELQSACTSAKRAQALLTASRREQTGNFDLVHRRFLDALAPHVGAGLSRATIRESLQAPTASEAGFIVLNTRGEVELANQVGERWLSSPETPGRPGRLWALHILAWLLARSLTPEGSEQVPEIDVSEPATGALHRLRAERSTAADGDERVIILIEPVRWGDHSEALRRLGLTRREADVTLGLLRGASLEMVARDTGASVHTIAQHQQNVFAKLQVSSRHELMARLYGAS